MWKHGFGLRFPSTVDQTDKVNELFIFMAFLWNIRLSAQEIIRGRVHRV